MMQIHLPSDSKARLVEGYLRCTQCDPQARYEGIQWTEQFLSPVEQAMLFNNLRRHWWDMEPHEREAHLVLAHRAEESLKGRYGAWGSVGAAFDPSAAAATAPSSEELQEDTTFSQASDALIADHEKQRQVEEAKRKAALAASPGEVNLQFDVTGTLILNGEGFNGILPQGKSLASYLAQLPNNSVRANVAVKLRDGADAIAWRKAQGQAAGKIPPWLYGDNSGQYISLKDLTQARYNEFRIEQALTNLYRIAGGTSTVTIEINIEWKLFGPIVNLWDRGTETWLDLWAKAKQAASAATNAASDTLKAWAPWIVGTILAGGLLKLASSAATGYAIGYGARQGWQGRPS